MKLGIVIMSHPKRREWAEGLSRKLDAPVVYDWQGDPSDDPERRWRVGLACWKEAKALGMDWSMVLQDDSVVCRDFRVGMESALTVLGRHGLVSPYLGQGRPEQEHVRRAITSAEREDTPWVSTRSLNWGVAITVPTETIDPMLYWCSAPGNVGRNYDHRIGLFYRDVMRWRTWYLQPSLVDHRDGVSLIGHDNKELQRVAWNFIGENESATAVDYAKVPKHGLPLDTTPDLRRGSPFR